MKFNKNEFGWSTKNESSSSGGGGLTTAQENKLNIAYNHSKEEHFSGDYNDLTNKPTNISEFNNDANYASETYVNNKIAEASLSGGESSNLINQNGGGALKIWAGTKVEYDALLVKDEDTVYLVEGAKDESITPITYTITNNLTNCTNSNVASTIDANNSYSATITANINYTLDTVTVTMGDTDITSTAYSNGSIFIDSITGDVVITANATQNSSGGEDIPSTPEDIPNVPTALYSLPSETTFSGVGNDTIDIGYGLFDADRDFTIFADFTWADDLAYSRDNQQILFRVKQLDSPWIGVDIAMYNEEGVENPTPRGSIRSSGTSKKGVFLGKISAGMPINDGQRHKVIIMRVASDKKMYFYDKDGLIGSYSDSGDVSQNPLTTHIILGGFSSGVALCFKGTLHNFKLWYEKLDESVITSLLS